MSQWETYFENKVYGSREIEHESDLWALKHTWVFRAGGSGKVCFNRGLRETSQQHWHAALPKPNEELGEVLPSYNLLSADNKDPTWQPVLPGEQRDQCLRCASLWCCRKPELRMLTVEGWMAHQSGKFCNISSYVSWASQTLQGSVYYSTAFSISWNSLV